MWSSSKKVAVVMWCKVAHEQTAFSKAPATLTLSATAMLYGVDTPVRWMRSDTQFDTHRCKKTPHRGAFCFGCARKESVSHTYPVVTSSPVPLLRRLATPARGPRSLRDTSPARQK